MAPLGDFFPDGVTFTWEYDNPLAYFNLGGLILAILILRLLKDRRDESSLAVGAWNGTMVLAIGTGLHFLGDILGVAETWDHQFIHLVVLMALIMFFIGVRRGD